MNNNLKIKFTGELEMIEDYVSFANNFDPFKPNAHQDIIEKGILSDDIKSFYVKLEASETVINEKIIFEFIRKDQEELIEFAYNGYEIIRI